MRTKISPRKESKIHNAVMDTLEQRTLFTAAPISLDTDFGNQGVVTQVQSSAGRGELTATNPVNGNVFVVGVNESAQTIASPYDMEEFNSAGAVVPTFGNNGLAAGSVQDPNPLAQEQPVAAAVQSDGKLLVLSASAPGYEVELYFLTRYTSTGLPDSTFGNGGTLEVDTTYTSFAGAEESLNLLPDGEIAMSGFIVTQNDSVQTSISMYTTAGVLDPSFGNDGVATGVAGSLDALTVDPAGNLVVAGDGLADAAVPPDAPTQGLVERFTPNGVLDQSFGNHGAVLAPNINYFSAVYADSSGIAATAVGATTSSSGDVGRSLELNHFTTTGKIDTSFGSGTGFVQPQIDGTVSGVEFQPDGKLLVTGGFGANAGSGFVRLTSNGILDNTFGSAGYENLGVGIVGAPVFEPEGQIVFLPYTTQSLEFEPERLLTNGNVDSSFGLDGVATGRTPFSSADAIADLPDGQILVAGEMTIGSVLGPYIERFNADGSLDTTFAAGQGYDGQSGYIFAGTEPLAVYGSYTGVEALAVDSQGRIYLNWLNVGILRFNSNGTIDKSFGTNGTYANPSADGFFIEPNGQILVDSASSVAITLISLGSNGQVDNTFGTNGAATFPAGFNPLNGVMTTQANGQILVGGNIEDTALNSDLMAVVRLNSNGSLDSTFGTRGLAIADSLPEEDQVQTESSYAATPSAIAVLSNGTIVLSGSGGVTYHGGRDIGPTIAEFLPNGQLNSAFGTGGQTSAFVPDNDYQASANSLIVESDGTLVTAGTLYAGNLPYTSSSFLIARYSSNGTVENFRTDNFAALNPATQTDPYTTLTQAVAGPDGTLLALGDVTSPNERATDPVLADYIIPQTQIPLAGAVIGTPGSYQKRGNTSANVFDDNLSTFFDAPTASGSYVGQDLDFPAVITQISYAPRPGFASRMIGGVFQASNSAAFTTATVNLYTITAAPTVGVLTTVVVSNPTAYRYVRYVGPADSYCNIAELQFAGSDTATAIIGTAGSYENQGNTLANAFDGNLSTFFDAPTASGAWVGLNLGSAKSVTQVSFAPRAGFTSRMVGGEIQASNTADFSSGVVTAYTITKAPAAGVLTTANLASVGAYRYWRYIGPTGSYCNISELEFDGV